MRLKVFVFLGGEPFFLLEMDMDILGPCFTFVERVV